jgi:hypothetical protein
MKSTAVAKPAQGLVVYQAAACRDAPGEWVVRGVNYTEDRELYIARFAGSGAQGRAEEYASWKNGQIARSTAGVG